MNIGRLVGIVLTVVGFGLAVIVGLWIVLQIRAGEAAGGFSPSAGVLTAGVAFIPVGLLVGLGVFMFVRGGQETEVESSMHQQRQLLDIVKGQGQVNISDLALEMRLSVDTVKDLIYQLVGLQVFSGYINWEAGVLYSAEARALRELEKCKNCGSEINLVGQGVVVCKDCGTEYFLP